MKKKRNVTHDEKTQNNNRTELVINSSKLARTNDHNTVYLRRNQGENVFCLEQRDNFTEFLTTHILTNSESQR